MSSTEHQPCEGCTKHHQIIQEYCETCGELLCTQCLHVGHAADHKTLNYADHLEKRKREVAILLQRVGNVKHVIDELQQSFYERKEKFQQGLQLSTKKIESFKDVKRAMQDWKIRNENMLQRKKNMQHQILDNAHRSNNPRVTIERPKVWIRTKARASLHSTIKGLTPNLVLSISGATAFSRRYTIDQKTPFQPNTFQKSVNADNASLYAQYDDSELYIASSTSACSDGSSGMSVTDAEQLAQKMQPPAATPERPIPRPRKSQNPRPVSQPVLPPQFPTPLTRLGNAVVKKKPTPTTAVLENPPTSAEKSYALQPRRDPLPPAPYLDPIITNPELLGDDIYDDPDQENYDDIVSPASTKPDKGDIYISMLDECEPEYEDLGYTYIDNNEINPPNQPLPPIPKIQGNEATDQDNAYTYIDDKHVTLMRERQLPPLPEPPPPPPLIPPTGSTPALENIPKPPPPAPPALEDCYEVLPEDLPTDMYGIYISPEKKITLKPTNQPLPPVLPKIQGNEATDQDNAYTYIDDKHVTLMRERELPPLPESPPPLPPRTGKTAEDYYKALPDTKETSQDIPIYGNITNPKEITLETTGIILSGYTAASFKESVELEDVCTAPLGSMIFTDPKNSCLRILMSTDERAHKITRQLKGQLQAVTYDQSNKRILIASEKGLNQLDFDEHKPNKITTKNVIKEIVPLCVTTTKTGDIYATTGPSSHRTDGETFIYSFKQNGKFATKLEMKGQPCGIDYKDGYLVVANLQDNNLHKIKTNGHPNWDKDVDARKKGVLHVPFRVAILPNHNIVVSETRRHCISVFSKEGQHVLRFGHFGEEPGMFNRPTGIAVRLDKELVVVDAGNKRIQLFALDKLNEQFEIAVAEKESKEVEIAVADKESQEAVDKSMDIYDEVADNDLEVEI